MMQFVPFQSASREWLSYTNCKYKHVTDAEQEQTSEPLSKVWRVAVLIFPD